MQSRALPSLVIVPVVDDHDFEAMVTVRLAARPGETPPRIENLRHHLASSETLVYLVARLGDEPVACGFVDPWPDDHAEAHLIVVPSVRRRGIGSALLAEFGARSGKDELLGEVRENDLESRGFLERRGYRVVGGEKAVALDLEMYDAEPQAPPAGLTIVSRAERPDLVEALYPIGREAVEDIPGNSGPPTLEQWLAIEIDRPTRKPELFFVALAGDEPIGYATMDDFGRTRTMVSRL
jgi:ribosomal protein S18 acetylase RimI-like enzyme